MYELHIDKAVERAVDSQLNSNMAVEQANCAEETLLPRTLNASQAL